MPVTVAALGRAVWHRGITARSTTNRPWAAGGVTNADSLFFGCERDHKQLTEGGWRTEVTDAGRLAWTDGTGPPRINHAHHPDELLRGDPDPPDDRDA